MNQTEAHRLAAAVNQLRPEWPLASLSAFIHKNLITRAYRDAVVALTWVACDAESLTPARVLENGPWWKATQAQEGTVSTITHRCPDHPDERLWDCAKCRDAAVSDPEQVAAGLAQLRAAIPRRTTRHEPEPTLTDIAHRQTQETDHG